MPKLYDPRDWYWQADDGRVFGSARGALIPGDAAADEAFAGWGVDGALPTVWPRDDAGAQTDAALAAVLAPYGLSAAIDPRPVDLFAYAKAKRDATEAAGITVNGVAIASDTDSQNRVNNAYNGMLVSGVTAIPFKSGSGFVTLTLDQVKAIGAALFAHTQACFSAEDQVDAALSASPPAITTAAEVDAVFAAVTSAF